MQAWSVGAGLAALGFWAFIAVVIWVGVWDSIRKRDAQHETLRRAIESGHAVDRDLTQKLYGGDDHLDRDLMVGALILGAIAPGLALLGWILGMAYPEAMYPLLGVAAMVVCIALGMFAAARYAARVQEATQRTGRRA